MRQQTQNCLNNPPRSSQSILRPTPPNEVHDLICVGFGPASLAIAIALSDELESRSCQPWQAKVAFLERQAGFAWHAGMLLPEAKMQISFIKDLATLRNPCSEFTFLNYLKKHNRLVQFSNLGTFLPSRLEFEDYMRWCSQSFTDVVHYHQEVVTISPKRSDESQTTFNLLALEIRDVRTGESTTRLTRNVVIAVGGKPSVPAMFSEGVPRVLHSSQYANKITSLLPIRDKPYHITVVGAGQSAAEIFNDLHSRYPNSSSTLIIRDTALRPSDDSPFVNEIFDPEAVNSFYHKSTLDRAKSLLSNKSTNYSVVRPELLERIYETLYQQRIKQPDKNFWKHQILPTREIVEVLDRPQSKQINLMLKSMDPTASKSKEIIVADAVILATGYVRNAHLEMLKDCQVLNSRKDGQWYVGRDYKVELDPARVGEDVGIWLQGCNESSHGLSDSLLSILATRSGELVRSIFKKQTGEEEVV